MYGNALPRQLALWEETGAPGKTHVRDFRQSVDRLFSHESVAWTEPTISEVKGACSDDCATEFASLAASLWTLYGVYHYWWESLET
jgi:hypothetical protein